MMKEQLLSCLPAGYPWADALHYFPTIGSTNDTLKELARQGASQGTAILAGHQTGGHGRLGRSFHSPQDKGIYLSILLRPDCAPADLMHLTCAAAVAMCDALESAAHFRPAIKWTNDLVYGRKKLGGILTELALTSQGNVDWVIIGIGINCAQQQEDFPEEIRSMAASLNMVTGQTIDPVHLSAAMLTELHRMSKRLLTDKVSILDAYRRSCITLGQEISVLRGENVRHGRALDVDEDGALIVSYDGGAVESVSSGEVSIRGMYGYV